MVAFAKQSVYGSEKKQEMVCKEQLFWEGTIFHVCHCWSGGGYVHQFDRSSNDRLYCSSLFAVFFHVVSPSFIDVKRMLWRTQCNGPAFIVKRMIPIQNAGLVL